MPFTPKAYAPRTGVGRPREQINTVSSYIDAWAVYGGTEERLEWLREGPLDGDMSNNEATLLMPGDLLPRRTDRGDAATAPTMDLNGQLIGQPDRAMVAGDVRANENTALLATHTLFAREHNRIVSLLPNRLTEEQKFQIARRVVIAEQQYITYSEFLPSLGIRLPRYRGYNPRVNPNLSNEFATVGYRAHSMIHGELELETEAARYTAEQLEAFEAMGLEVELSEDGAEVGIAVPLNLAFFNPDLVPSLGLGPVLQGIGLEAEYNNDEQIDNQLRSVLFQVPSSPANPGCLDGPELPACYDGVLDLGAIDIERAVTTACRPTTSCAAPTGSRPRPASRPSPASRARRSRPIPSSRRAPRSTTPTASTSCACSTSTATRSPRTARRRRALPRRASAAPRSPPVCRRSTAPSTHSTPSPAWSPRRMCRARSSASSSRRSGPASSGRCATATASST
jgi:hypothetical protein